MMLKSILTHNSEKRVWFEKELAELSLSSLVKLTVYVTRTVNTRTPTSDEQASNEAITHAQSFETSGTDIADPEISASATVSCFPTAQALSLPVILGRPSISVILRDFVSATEEHERTIVASCGPESLMKETRSVVRDLVAGSGRSVAFHCEQFGW
jgi:hypothetical protein